MKIHEAADRHALALFRYSFVVALAALHLIEQDLHVRAPILEIARRLGERDLRVFLLAARDAQECLELESEFLHCASPVGGAGTAPVIASSFFSVSS